MKSEKYGIDNPRIKCTEEEFELEVEDAYAHMYDLVPYSNPNHDEEVMKMAIGYAVEYLDPESDLNKMCAEHDKLLEEGKIDH